MTSAPTASPPGTPLERFGPWLFGALTLLPFVVCRADIAQLFWFGDEWDLLDEIDRWGFWRWTWVMFTENFVPLFKIAWGSLVFAGGGSYFLMMAVLWLTHAINVALLGKLLLGSDLGWIATALTLGVFGFAVTNIETLGWSVQWSPVLSVTFLLAAAHWHFRHAAATSAWSLRVHGVLALLVTASALSFSRGVLTGAALAAISFVPVAADPSRRRARFVTAAVCMLPCAVVAALILALASPDTATIGEPRQIGSMARFALYYLAQNPLHRILELPRVTLPTVAWLGALKLALVAWCWMRSSGRVRRLFLFLLVLDIGNAALLGLGRAQTGITETVGARYQYVSLLCTLPFAGYALEALLRRCFGARVALRTTVATLFVVSATWYVGRRWPLYMSQFANVRGTATRVLLFEDPNPPRARAIRGIPALTTRRAKQLVEIYHLH